MPPVIAIVGPTATGKTDVAVRLARTIGGEIISADSMAVYRGMDVGTAKPTAAERAIVPFHLIDVAEPDERYNVSRFGTEATAALREIESRGAKALLVGGTGLYVRALLEGYGLTSTPADPSVRLRLEQKAAEQGVQALHAQLKEVDSVSAERIHVNDRVRIIRALEVFAVSGEPISRQQHRDRADRKPIPAIKFALVAPREELYRRIDDRVDAMVRSGLVDEVRELLSRGYCGDIQPLNSLGYKEITAFLRGQASLEEAVATIKQNTRRFAKRQITWFRADKELNWIDTHGKSAAEVANEVLTRLPT